MNLFSALKSPVLLAGDAVTAYRDPAAIYEGGVWHLFFTLVEQGEDGLPFMYTAKTSTRDFISWTPVRKLTPPDRSKNYSSPGNIIRLPDGRFAMCLQTYCRENGEKYGNARSRLYLMTSSDLENWSEPALLRVKGDDVCEEDMGRMIDPYLVQKDGVWWCFFKQNGVSFSSSPDLIHWTFEGSAQAGENVCILPEGGGYLLFHSPENGVGVKRSHDLLHWEACGELITLGQSDWPWAQGRLTAGFVLDARDIPGVECYVMFFHASGPYDESVYFDDHASVGIAWSNDLTEWTWPGKQ